MKSSIFLRLVRLWIWNQSMMVKIPQPPTVRSLATPRPVSPRIKRSIPREPPKIDTRSIIIGSRYSIEETARKRESSMSESCSRIKGSWAGSKNLWLVARKRSTFWLSISYLVSCVERASLYYDVRAPLRGAVPLLDLRSTSQRYNNIKTTHT